MRKCIHLLTLGFLLISPAVGAQSETTDLTQQTEPADKTRQAMFNLQNPTAALTAGGAFYVSNPAAAYEVDAEKAYLNPDFQPFSVILETGQEFAMPGRIRLVDQKVEVKAEGGVYELDGPAIRAVIDPDGRVFIPAFDPLARTKGLQWYEVAFAGKHYRFMILETTVWQDPPQKNMFDTSEPKKTLKRVTRYFLVAPDKNVEVDKMKDLLSGLSDEDKATSASLVRQKRLRNTLEDYLTLLRHLEGE